MSCRRFALVSMSLISVLLFSSCGAKVTSSKPPVLPQLPFVSQKVIDAWNLPPSSSNGIPPAISKQLTLQPYGKPNSSVTVDNLFSNNSEWVDIVVKAQGDVVNFGNQTAGEVGVLLDGAIGGWNVGNPVGGYKYLYVEPGYVSTFTNGGTVYTTGMRIFSNFHHPSLDFMNFDPNNTVSITYEIYYIANTPEWADISTRWEVWAYSPQIEDKNNQEQVRTMLDEWLRPFGLGIDNTMAFVSR